MAEAWVAKLAEAWVAKLAEAWVAKLVPPVLVTASSLGSNSDIHHKS